MQLLLKSIIIHALSPKDSAFCEYRKKKRPFFIKKMMNTYC